MAVEGTNVAGVTELSKPNNSLHYIRSKGGIEREREGE